MFVCAVHCAEAPDLCTLTCVCVLCVLQENLKLSPAMLSRFDLIFVLLDRPDELMDQALSEHIMALHSGKRELGYSDVLPPRCAPTHKHLTDLSLTENSVTNLC